MKTSLTLERGGERSGFRHETPRKTVGNKKGISGRRGKLTVGGSFGGRFWVHQGGKKTQGERGRAVGGPRLGKGPAIKKGVNENWSPAIGESSRGMDPPRREGNGKEQAF